MLLLTSSLLQACTNNPYLDHEEQGKVVYSAFSTPPKTLDPAVAYSTIDHEFTAAVYDTLLAYDYFARPYRLVPGIAEEVPVAESYGELGVLYRFKLRKGLRFDDDPCFEAGVGRQIVAADIAFQLARLADPEVGSPVLEPFSSIEGFMEFRARLKEISKTDKAELPAVERYRLAGGLSGVEVKGEMELVIRLHESYPQILYWLALPFSAPVPHEAVSYYDGEAGREQFAEHPVSSGPYRLSHYDKRAKIVLERNPHWYGVHYPKGDKPAPGVFFPVEGPKGKTVGASAGQRMPFIDRVEYRREEEAIPLFSKFLQGYYEASGISRENFDQVIQEGGLSEEMQAQGIHLEKTIMPTVFYIGFNMNDPVVGAPNKERGRKLRQAMSLTIDSDEFLELFVNGRGRSAQTPVPPGIFGYEESYQNVYRKPDLDRARQLLKEAGYENGIDPQTGRPLRLSFDAADTSPRGLLTFQYFVGRWRPLGLDVRIAATNYNKFQEKVRDGAYQIFQWGWQADYPDPENFFFLLTTEMARSKSGGPNSANFMNAQFDQLFSQMRTRDNDATRQAIIVQMRSLLEEERPWIELYHSEEYELVHSWYKNVFPQGLSNPTHKFVDLDVQERTQKRKAWNQPIYWPLALLALLLVLLIVPLYFTYRKERL